MCRASALRLGEYERRLDRGERPDDDRGFAILDLLHNAVTKRFSRNQVRIPPDRNTFFLELLRQSARELDMSFGVADENVRHMKSASLRSRDIRRRTRPETGDNAANNSNRAFLCELDHLGIRKARSNL
jgi:hypothetical protein